MKPVPRLLLLALLVLPAAVLARVTPPPLPPGSEQVQIEPGLQEAERKRAVRAHRAHPIRPRNAASAPQVPNQPRK